MPKRNFWQVAIGVVIALSTAFVVLDLYGRVIEVFPRLSGSGTNDHYLLFFLPFFIGLLQLIYVVPLRFYMRRNNYKDMATGVMCGAVIVFVLNIAVIGALIWLGRMMKGV